MFIAHAWMCGGAAVISTIAVNNSTQVAKNGWLYTEEDWNTYSTIESEPYYVSKVGLSWHVTRRDSQDIKLATSKMDITCAEVCCVS